MAKTKRRPQSSKKKSQNKVGLWIGLAGVILVIAAMAWLLIGGAADAPPKVANTLAADISVDEAYQLYQDGVFVLDVREQDEWDDFHAPKATLIPLGELEDRVNEVPKDGPVVVICNSGNRSKPGRDILLNAGFSAVTSVDGGMQAWRKAGYPVE